jgi:putative DNA primase/helicase
VVSIDRAPFERGDHVEIADRLVAKLRAEAPLTFTDNRFYQYSPKSGIFESIAESKLSTIVQDFAGLTVKTVGKPKPLRLFAGDVRGAIKLAGDRAEDPEFFTRARRGIAFVGAFVEVTEKAIVLHEYSPEHLARFAYPFGFVRDARPERLLGFFGDVFRDDTDRDAKVGLIQEYLGASLLGLATKYQRALVFVGDGANGKGVLCSVIERCMPPGSVCSIPPQDVGQEYRRAALAGRLLNIVSELPESDIMDAESWKAVVAGDAMTGREIRQSPFTFRPIAGHIYSANRLPASSDQSHGFWRRILMVSWNRIFDESEQNPNLADEILAAEQPAIVSWMLAGAQRVMAQGRFTVPDTAAKALDRWRVQADQVRAFVDEQAERLPADVRRSDGTQAEQVYRAYKYWAHENGHKALASNKFGERMRLLGLEAKSDGHARRHPIKLARGCGDGN